MNAQNDKAVTVVVPTSNAGDGLLLSIGTFVEFAGYPFELYVYDYNSTDGSVDTLRSLYPDVNVISTDIVSIEERMHVGVSNSTTQLTLVFHTDIEFIDYGFLWEAVKLIDYFEKCAAVANYRPTFYFDDNHISYPGFWSSFVLLETQIYKQLDQKHGCYNCKPGSGNAPRDRIPIDPALSVDDWPIRFCHVLLFSGYTYFELPDYITSKLIHYNSAVKPQGTDIKPIDDDLKSDRGPNRIAWKNVRSSLISRRAQSKDWKARRLRPHLVWGVGVDALEYAERLENYGIDVIGLVEDNPNLWEDVVEGRKVYPARTIFDLENIYVTLATPDYESKAHFLTEAGLRYLVDFNIFLIKGHHYHLGDFYIHITTKSNMIAFSMKESGKVYRNISIEHQYIPDTRFRKEDAFAYLVRSNNYIRQSRLLDRIRNWILRIFGIQTKDKN